MLFLDTIYIQYVSKIMYPVFPDTSDYSQIDWTTVVSVVNDILVFGKVEYQLPSFQ